MAPVMDVPEGVHLLISEDVDGFSQVPLEVLHLEVSERQVVHIVRVSGQIDVDHRGDVVSETQLFVVKQKKNSQANNYKARAATRRATVSDLSMLEKKQKN